jgi:hypothetical protein
VDFGVYCVLLLSVLHAWAGVSVLNFSGSRFTSYATLDVMSELQVFLRITDSTFSISCSSHRYHIYYTSVLLVTRDVVCRKRWRERKRGTVHDPFGTAVSVGNAMKMIALGSWLIMTLILTAKMMNSPNHLTESQPPETDMEKLESTLLQPST